MSDSETSKRQGRRDVAEDDDGPVCVADGVSYGATPVAEGTKVKTWKTLGHKCGVEPVAELRLLQGDTLAGWVRRLAGRAPTAMRQHGQQPRALTNSLGRMALMRLAHSYGVIRSYY